MEDAIRVLELKKILEDLASYSYLDFRKEDFINLPILYDINKIQEELDKVEEAIRVINRFGQFSFDYIHNIKEAVEKAYKGGILNEEQLYRVGSQYKGIETLKNFYQSVKVEDYPITYEILSNLTLLKDLYNAIDNVISDDLTVYDGASSELRRIRKEIASKNIELRRRLDSICKAKAEYLTDSVVTMRNDRYVIPVKPTYKNTVKGIIHDESASNQSVFIEPEEIVLVNNEISLLKAQERVEVERILRELSSKVALESDVLLKNLTLLLDLDFMLTKGAYAISYDGITAELSKTQEIKLFGARHPLIDKTKVIANDFEIFKPTNQILLITGPNTGGKTVSLKTVGLLTLMNQVGLAIPTNKKSTLGIFNDVFVDIGDDQNIKESLSTFSSHLSKLIKMVDNCDEKSLILVDEIGNGTDPLEGETLAMALLEEFHNAGSLILATTHYHNLKTFGVEKDYICNCSMTFDLDTLRPTYKLISGVAGRSYAFEIASSLNLKGYIIDNARRYKDKYIDDNSKLVDKLEQTQLLNEKLKEDLEIKNKLADERLKEAEILKKNIQNDKIKIEENAAKEVEKLVSKYKEDMDNIMEELKHKDDLKLHNVIEAKTKLKEVFNDEAKEEDSFLAIFKVGETVRIDDVDRVGKIISINKDIATVNVNGLSLKTKLSTLSHTDEIIKEEKKIVKSEVKLNKSGTECNLIGMYVEDALIVLDKFLDNALRYNLKQVRIIHGFGTGRLRNAVWEFLKKKKYVSKYYYAGQFDGGGGATIVELK